MVLSAHPAPASENPSEIWQGRLGDGGGSNQAAYRQRAAAVAQPVGERAPAAMADISEDKNAFCITKYKSSLSIMRHINGKA